MAVQAAQSANSFQVRADQEYFRSVEDIVSFFRKYQTDLRIRESVITTIYASDPHGVYITWRKDESSGKIIITPQFLCEGDIFPVALFNEIDHKRGVEEQARDAEERRRDEMTTSFIAALREIDDGGDLSFLHDALKCLTSNR